MAKFLSLADAMGCDNANKLKKIPFQLQKTAKSWFGNFKSTHDPLAIDPVAIAAYGALTFRNAFEEAFKTRLTEEQLLSRLKNRKYREDESVEAYFYSVQRLCDVLHFTPHRSIKALLQGLPTAVATQIGLMSPDAPIKILQLLKHRENLGFLLGSSKKLLKSNVNAVSFKDITPPSPVVNQHTRDY